MQEESWDQLVRDADEISAECVSGPSKQIYQSRINVYVAALTKMNIEPYPITIEKMKGFLMKLVRDKKQFTTIQSYIAGFSFYFRQNDLDVLTNSIEFKNFKSGLRRKLQGSKCPKAKLPFDPSWFEIIFQKFPPNNVYDRKFFFYMTISFCAFLRISELRNLKYKDLVLSDDKSTLSILIESSKTDQFGRGIQTYVYNNNKIWCPILYLDAFEGMHDDDIICHLSETALRSHLYTILATIGIENFNSYSWHSFRRGGAYISGCNGVSDSVIKAHGRWKSDAYIRYVSVEMPKAGREIADVFSNI